MDDGELIRRAFSGNREFFRMLGRLPGATVHEAPGVVASIVPRTPDRSVVNCVTYDEAGALAAALDELAAAYRTAGVHAWTVWVPADDREAMQVLARAGHAYDGEPTVMGLEMETVRAPDLAGIDWRRAPDHAGVGAINDAAYGYEGSFGTALAGLADPRARSFVASVDGRPAACVTTFDEAEDDCHVGLVATEPRAQRRGLASALLAQGLVEARDRGALTSTLLSSVAGRPVYQRLGYRELGTMQLWERRGG